MEKVEQEARAQAGWGEQGVFDTELPLQVMSGVRPDRVVVLWKGHPVPYLRKVTWRWDGAPEVILAHPNANAHLGVTAVDSEKQRILREKRDEIARDMRRAGIPVVIA